MAAKDNVSNGNVSNDKLGGNGDSCVDSREDWSGFFCVVTDVGGATEVGWMSADDATSLLDCMCECPATWEDLASVWPRHVFEDSAIVNLQSYPVERKRGQTLSEDTEVSAWVLERLKPISGWLLLDLTQRRLWLSESAEERWGELEPLADDGGLPPGWEILTTSNLQRLAEKRDWQPQDWEVRRDVLWGEPLLQDLAGRLVKRSQQDDDWKTRKSDGSWEGRYAETVAVHRDWLMTPRSDLDGGIPRERLHLGQEWIRALIGRQEAAIMSGESAVPLPVDFSNLDSAPMGLHEMFLYFEACRDLIQFGWQWLIAEASEESNDDLTQRLMDALQTRLEQWWEMPFEESDPPSRIINLERHRMPLVDEAEPEPSEALPGPLAELLNSYRSQPAFVYFDASSMDLDGEFAFSSFSDEEDWRMCCYAGDEI